MIKKCVGYILYCCLIYFIGYIVSALFTRKQVISLFSKLLGTLVKNSEYLRVLCMCFGRKSASAGIQSKRGNIRTANDP